MVQSKDLTVTNNYESSSMLRDLAFTFEAVQAIAQVCHLTHTENTADQSKY
jgi:hypothetical protein